MAAKLEYWKRGKPARGWYTVDQATLDALKPGQVVYLREGSAATFEKIDTTPAGANVAAVVYPDGISFTNANRNLEFSVDPRVVADWWIEAAEQLGPQGAYAVSLRSPMGALTRPGKLLRSIDAAKAERDPEKRRVLAASALSEARAYSGKPAPANAPPPLPTAPASTAPSASKTEQPAGSTPWGLIAGGVLLGLALLGSSSGASADDDDED